MSDNPQDRIWIALAESIEAQGKIVPPELMKSLGKFFKLGFETGAKITEITNSDPENIDDATDELIKSMNTTLLKTMLEDD